MAERMKIEDFRMSRNEISPLDAVNGIKGMVRNNKTSKRLLL